MKRLLCLLLTLILCFSLMACHDDQPKLQAPVNFYYPRLEPTYGTANGMIAPVSAEGAGFDQETLLNRYLQGPADKDFVSPFPADTKLLSLTDKDTIINLQLNQNFAQLTGMDLTLACACLTLTTIELTGADTVRIFVKDSTLDGAPQIVMDRNCLTMLDIYTPEST